MTKDVKASIDWERVFEIRCRSKRGIPVSSDEERLVREAHASNPYKYRALESRIFDETHPAGPLRKKEK
jgi:hypothetical protein